MSDNGSGIAPEVLPHVFEPFFTTKEVGRGSGLGLSMVHGFVNQSGGQVRLSSELGRGTTVKLYFPRSFAQAPAVSGSATRSMTIGGDEPILVVEDDVLVRRHVTRLLEGLGYPVLQATTGLQALDILEADLSIRLLFTDLVMPGGMNGEELVVRALATRPDLKVLFTSGYAENAIVHDGRLDPGIHLLSKPYSRDELAHMVRTLLDYRRPSTPDAKPHLRPDPALSWMEPARSRFRPMAVNLEGTVGAYPHLMHFSNNMNDSEDMP